MLVSGGGRSLLFSLRILLCRVQSFSFHKDSCIFITLSITTVWDIWKHFLSIFFFPLVAINYFNNDYLATSQGASAWQLLIRFPTTSRADWLMSLLHCRWPPAARPTASPAWGQTRGHSHHSFPRRFVPSISIAWPALSVNPQLPGSSQAMPWYHQNQHPQLHLPGRMLSERGTDTWRPLMKIRDSFKSLLRHN